MKALIQNLLVTLGLILPTGVLFYEVTRYADAGEMVRVGIIDTGLDLSDVRFKSHLCPSGHKDFSGEGLTDNIGHGTHVAGLAKQYARTASYCLVIVKYFNPSRSVVTNESQFIAALAYTLSLNLDVVNLSVSGPDYVQSEFNLIKLHPKTLIVGAAGNVGSGVVHYPCGYSLPNTLCVGAVESKGGEVTTYSNYGSWVQAWEVGSVLSTLPDGKVGLLSGSSMSSAIFTGKTIFSIDSRRR